MKGMLGVGLERVFDAKIRIEHVTLGKSLPKCAGMDDGEQLRHGGRGDEHGRGSGSEVGSAGTRPYHKS